MNKLDITPEIRDKVKEVYKELSSIRKTRDKVNELLDLDLDYHNVRNILIDIGTLKTRISESKNIYEEKINTMAESLKRLVRYEFIDNEYIITVKDKDLGVEQLFRFSKEEVRDIFRDYSRHGGDKGGEEMIAKYCNGYPEVWNIIKSRFRVYKPSHIVDPDTLENADEEELDLAMDNAVNYHIDVKKQKLEKKFKDTIKREYYKLLERVTKGELFLDKMNSIIKGYKPEIFNPVTFTKLQRDYAIAIGADSHFDGSKEGDEGFLLFVDDLCDVKEKRILAIINGDDLETIIEAGMHPGQVNDMDKTGKSLITHFFSLWEYAVKKLQDAGKEVEIVFNVDSNHMRIDENYKKDNERLGSWLMFSYLQLKLQMIGADVKLFEDKTNTMDYDIFSFIVDHGSEGFNKKNAKDIVYEYGGSKDKINVIISAHDHNVTLTNPGENIFWIKLPALKFKNGRFEKKHLLSSNPGYVILSKNKRGLPSTEVVILK